MPTVEKSLLVDTFPSELGWMALLSDGEKLVQLTFGHSSPKEAIAKLDAVEIHTSFEGGWNPEAIARLQAFAEGADVDLSDIPVDLGKVTVFQQRVFDMCRQIPYGQTLTYGELAKRIGQPRAARAVGNTMARNNLPLVIPCHRVVPACAGIGNYSAGEGRRSKLRLLENEASKAPKPR